MTDLLHTHIAFGFHHNCPACDQLAADLQRAAEKELAEGTLVPV